MESFQKNIQLMREFLKTPFLVLYFSYYTLMIFLTMLSVILLSVLMILLSLLSVIGHLICSNYLNWLLNLNLIYETLWTGVRSGLLISHSVHWCINAPFKSTIPLFFANPPLNRQTVQAPPF